MEFSRLGRLGFASIATAVVLATALVPISGGAQERASARTVAARVQAFYDQSDTFQAEFQQTYFNRLYGRYDRSRGRMVFDKPGRMRFDYARPNGKVIVSNGTKLTMYEPTDGHGAGQFVETRVEDAPLPAAFSFLTGDGRLEDQYSFRLLDSSAWRYRGHVLELRPKRADSRYARVILFVDASPSRAGVVHAIRIDDHDGNRNKFELRAMRFDRPVSQSTFAFTPPAGARRVQM